jgi:hypothetical protein
MKAQKSNVLIQNYLWDSHSVKYVVLLILLVSNFAQAYSCRNVLGDKTEQYILEQMRVQQNTPRGGGDLFYCHGACTANVFRLSKNLVEKSILKIEDIEFVVALSPQKNERNEWIKTLKLYRDNLSDTPSYYYHHSFLKIGNRIVDLDFIHTKSKTSLPRIEEYLEAQFKISNPENAKTIEFRRYPFSFILENLILSNTEKNNEALIDVYGEPTPGFSSQSFQKAFSEFY